MSAVSHSIKKWPQVASPDVNGGVTQDRCQPSRQASLNFVRSPQLSRDAFSDVKRYQLFHSLPFRGRRAGFRLLSN
jgi:hypothetical protein